MTAPLRPMDATRARSFDAWAGDYDRYRPGYPEELFQTIQARLQLPAHPLVVDLGAGTGRASLAMAELGWRVTAIEPGKPMLDVMRGQAANRGLLIATVQASAESTGLDPASADLATAAQAFHWFEQELAIAEMARIVKPGGGVALFWNVRDESRSAFVTDYHALLQKRFGDADTGQYLQAGRPMGRDGTRAAFAGTRSFEPPELIELHHDVPMTADDFVGMAFTASYIRSLPPQEQDRFRLELAALLGRHGLNHGRPFAVPYRIDLWIARRSDR
jgi:SAM-dependent methyltransferase